MTIPAKNHHWPRCIPRLFGGRGLKTDLGRTTTLIFAAYMKKHISLDICEPAAEAIKTEEGSAFDPPAEKIMMVKGIYLPRGSRRLFKQNPPK